MVSFFEKLKSKRFKFMRFLGMVGIFFLTTESIHENTLVPLIAPLVGTAFMVMWVVLVEMIKIEGERKMDNEEYITVDYPTISVAEKRQLMELCSSTLVNAFNFEDYMSVLAVFRGVVDRLEE